MLGLTPLLGKLALKLANKGINERSLQHEHIGKDLCHRHFVKVYECSDVWIHAEACPGLTFEKKSLLMELCQGGSLAELTLHQANLSGSLGKGMARAVPYLHGFYDLCGRLHAPNGCSSSRFEAAKRSTEKYRQAWDGHQADRFWVCSKIAKRSLIKRSSTMISSSSGRCFRKKRLTAIAQVRKLLRALSVAILSLGHSHGVSPHGVNSLSARLIGSNMNNGEWERDFRIDHSWIWATAWSCYLEEKIKQTNINLKCIYIY